MKQYTWDDFVYFLKRGYTPATKLIIGASVLIYFATVVMMSVGRFDLPDMLAFSSSSWVAQPWTFVTYPFVCGPGCFLTIIFSSIWMWFVGGSLERGWGTRVFTCFFFAVSAITAISLTIGAYVVGTSVALANLWMPLAALTIAWATLDPEQQILFYFVIPLKVKYLAWLDIAIVFLSYVRTSPLLGLFALGGCAAAWQYVLYRWRSPGRETEVIRLRRPRSRRLNPFAWLREHRERRRLRRLFGEDGEDREGWR